MIGPVWYHVKCDSPPALVTPPFFLSTGNVVNIEVKEEKLCPRFPEPVLLEHPIPALKEALEKVDNNISNREIMNGICLIKNVN